uniref:Rootletin-like coiled-coil domain-containing protein n=1 Tax=Ditylenchus dipsaci TaxID=166011 RepID=A0A915EFJ1_9BILA
MSGEIGDGRQLGVSNPSTSVSLPLLTVSADDLYQVPFDLNNYRRRIDAGVEEQRRQREIIEGLQDKVLKCRLKSAEPGILSLVPFSQIHFASTSKSIGFDRNVSLSSPGLHILESNSPPFLYNRLIQKGYDDEQEDLHNFGERLRNEQLRNLFLEEMVESLRHQVEATLGSNEVLSGDVVHLSECLQRETFARREDAQLVADRTMKQKIFLETFYQRLHELWIEFCALKRKVTDARNDIGFDLETQKSEFLRLRKTLEILVGQTKSDQSRHEKTSKAHEEAMEDIVRKYEELVRKNIEIELEKDKLARESNKLESSLSRTNEEKEGLENVLQRIHRLPEVKSMLDKRTRSDSPDVREGSSPSLRNASVLADVRSAFKFQTSEAESYKRKYEQARYKQTELLSQTSQLETDLREAYSQQNAEKSAHQDT